MKEFVKKVIPYSERDSDALEAWLEELAAEGLVLERDGYLGLVFRRTEPTKLRFRVDHTKGANLKQTARRREQLAEQGWQYAGSPGRITIYKNEDLGQWELPEWEESPKQNLFHKFGNVGIVVLAYIILIFMIGNCFILGGSIIKFIREDFYDLPVLAFFTLFVIVSCVVEVLRIKRIKMRKEVGSFSKRSYHTKERARWGSRRALLGIVLCFAIPMLVVFMSNRYDYWEMIPIQNYQKVLPVPQLSELVKEENSKRNANHLPALTEGKYLGRNEVVENRYFLMPREVMLYQEEGNYSPQGEGNQQNTYYDPFYYELRTEDLGKKVFEELQQEYPYEALPTVQGVEIFYYRSQNEKVWPSQALLMHQGKKIIQVTYGGNLDLKEYVYLFAQYLGVEESLTPRQPES